MHILTAISLFILENIVWSQGRTSNFTTIKWWYSFFAQCINFKAIKMKMSVYFFSMKGIGFTKIIFAKINGIHCRHKFVSLHFYSVNVFLRCWFKKRRVLTLNIFMQHVVKDFLAKDATSPVLLVDLEPVVVANAYQNVQNQSATLSQDANTIK